MRIGKLTYKALAIFIFGFILSIILGIKNQNFMSFFILFVISGIISLLLNNIFYKGEIKSESDTE